jgi:hypothetical protein
MFPNGAAPNPKGPFSNVSLTLIFNIRHFDAELMPIHWNTLRKGSTCSNPSYPDVLDRKDFPSPGCYWLSTPSGSTKDFPVLLA